MGQQLARLHHLRSEQGFGWQQSNTIGDTPSTQSLDGRLGHVFY